MKTIIVPVDYSINAKNAALYALHLAKRMEAKLVLLHVFNLPVLLTNSLARTFPLEELKQQHQTKLSLLAIELREKNDVPIELVALPGHITEELPAFVKEKSASLVVMGMQKKSMAERLLSGSITASVLQLASFPVLIVPFGSTFHPIKHLLFACDYPSLSGHNKLGLLKDIAWAFGAEVQVLNIEEPELVSVKVQERSKGGQHLDRLLKGTKHYYTFVQEENIIEGIESGLKNGESDLLVMVPRKHGFWETLLGQSNTYKMAYHTHIPLLALPNPEAV